VDNPPGCGQQRPDGREAQRSHGAYWGVVNSELWQPYEEIAEAYRDNAEDSVYNAYYDRPAVLDALGPVSGTRVLDAGCGPGAYAAALLDAGAQVVGFDASAAMVALARTRLGNRCRIDLARLGEPLPYPGESFDLSVCALAIHYVPDAAAAFAELHRVLRPGGALVLSTHHPTTDWLRKGGSYFDRVLESDVWTWPGGESQLRFWRVPLSQLCGWATDAGFLIERLIEPRPTEALRTRSPRHYAKLTREPCFVILRLRKLD
jgi:SAM-dependent methyltransferase